jgi:hypothetical protein
LKMMTSSVGKFSACTTICRFKHANKDRRVSLGRPEYGEPNTGHICACKLHRKCATIWAETHEQLPNALPCGCPMSMRGAEFWRVAVPERRARIMDEENKMEKERMKLLEKRNQLEMEMEQRMK